MAYSDEVLADSPLVYWKLDEASGQFQDSSGNARHTTSVFGSPSYQQAGGINEGFSITSGYAENNSGYFLPDIANWTLEAWIKTTETTNQIGIIELGQANPALYVSNMPTGNLRLLRSHIAVDQTSTTAINDGQWHHVVATNTAGVTKLYIDGVDRSGTSAGLTYTSASRNAGFGASWVTSASSIDADSEFLGSLDEIAIYGTGLSAARVLAHYEAGIASGFLPKVILI
jgi:hypothetical protein